jgi:hypothetical protein
MYYQRKEFRKIFAGLQMAAAGAMAIALATAPMSRAQSCDPPPTGTMVAWYSFDQTGPLSTAGQYTSANLATQNSGAWTSPTLPVAVVAGEVAGALNFNGNSYIDTPDSIVTNFGPALAATCSGGDYSTCQGNFSMDAWVNLTTVPLSGVNVIFDKRNTSEIGYSFYLYGQPGEENGYPWMGLQLGDRAHGYHNYGSAPLDPGTGNPNTGLVGLTANAWHHVAVTVPRRGTTGILWYLDGYLVTSPTNIPTQTGTLVNNVPLRIGANGPANGGGSYFNGSLDELQIFNRVLTATEVLDIYNALSSGQCKPL